VNFTEMAERRRGPRRDHWAEARWSFGIGGDGRRARTAPETAYIINLSTYGLALAARPSAEVTVGSMVTVEFGGVEGLLEVKRMDPIADSTETFVYGLEFADLGSPLAVAIRNEYFERRYCR
jgi:hypothetical protein